MKIAFLTEVYKPICNGVVNSVISFSKGLRTLSNTVYIFAPTYPNYKETEKYVYRFKSLTKLPEDYYLQLPISKKFTKLMEKCDIIHTHHPFIAGLKGVYLSKIHQIPLVFTHHTMYEDYAEKVPLMGKTFGFKNALNRYVEFFCSLCHCIIAPSKPIKEMLIKRGIKTKIIVIPTGIDVKKFQNANGAQIRKKYGKDIIVLYLGRIVPEKNIELLVDIFKTIKEKNVKFILVGDGTIRKKFQGKYKNIIFTGKVSETEPYYKAADIFASASTTETQGIVYIEAKAAGCPVVAMNALGAKDMVEKNDGFLVNSKEEFKEKLVKLIKDEKLRKKMSEAAIKNSEKHSITATSKKMLDVYESLI